MEESEKLNRPVCVKEFFFHLAFVVFDIIAVNFSYFIALVIRFYFNSEFNSYGAVYVRAFQKFAPWYTVACLAIFAVFKLYNNRWKYSGLNDLNRLLFACLVTCAVQVLGTALFVMRMPITYYVIGTVVQLLMIAASRFSYRFFLMEHSHIFSRKHSAYTPVMIVGVGKLSQQVRRHLECGSENGAHPVCFVDYRREEFGNLLDGLPVVNGVEQMPRAIKKYGISCVILADNTMPKDVRKAILDICIKQHVEVQDFAGYFQESFGSVTLRNLMEYVKGSVELSINGKSQSFANGEQAVMAITGKYLVKSVSARDNSLVVELQRDILVPNDINEEWVRNYVKETGKEISFF